MSNAAAAAAAAAASSSSSQERYDVVTEQAVGQLMEMGFSRSAAVDAWFKSGGRFDAAVEMLCTAAQT